MTRRYDAVVVGAGLGGLSAAAALARDGLKVCLLERHNVPGGYATSFVRGRFEFEVALHELSGIGSPEESSALQRYLGRLGLLDEVELVSVPELYRSVFPDLDAELPVGHDAYAAKLSELFPAETDGIHRFVRRIKETAEEVLEIAQHFRVGNPLTAPFRFPNALRLLPMEWEVLLAKDLEDPQLKAVVSQYWGYFGLPPKQVSGLLFGMALDTYLRYGPKYVRGRSQSLSNAFVRVFEANGGDVRFNCGVRQILTSSDGVRGVLTDDGETLEARYVISNADPVTTCHNLLGKDAVPAGFFGSLAHRTVAPSSMNVYLGLDCPPSELGHMVHENFVNADYDANAVYERFRRIERPGVTLVTCYNTVWDEISPPGTTMMVLTTLMYGEPWAAVAPRDYVETKNRMAEYMLQDAEKLAPGIRDHIEEVEVATPITNMRYTGQLGGSIYGFNSPPWDHTMMRMSPRGPVDGLYFAGAWTQPGGGFEPCMMSGKIASRMIRAELVRGGRR